MGASVVRGDERLFVVEMRRKFLWS